MRRLHPCPADAVDPVAEYGRLAPLAGGRPAVRVNMIASIDGASSAGGLSGALGGPPDKAVFAALRCLADVIVVGAATMRAEGYGPARLDGTARARRRGWGLPEVPPSPWSPAPAASTGDRRSSPTPSKPHWSSPSMPLPRLTADEQAEWPRSSSPATETSSRPVPSGRWLIEVPATPWWKAVPA